jgi:hypothetical protein
MRNVSDGALGRTWRQCRRAAYQGELSHARLFTLVKLAVGQQRLQLLHHWLPLILRQAVSEGERNGSAPINPPSTGRPGTSVLGLPTGPAAPPARMHHQAGAARCRRLLRQR